MSYVNFFNSNPENLIDLKIVQDQTLKDEQISRIIQFCLNGWPGKVKSEDLIFFKKRNELVIEEGILMWGYRVVIPTGYRIPSIPWKCIRIMRV